jgi:hypothetical protein
MIWMHFQPQKESTQHNLKKIDQIYPIIFSFDKNF